MYEEIQLRDGGSIFMEGNRGQMFQKFFILWLHLQLAWSKASEFLVILKIDFKGSGVSPEIELNMWDLLVGRSI